MSEGEKKEYLTDEELKKFLTKPAYELEKEHMDRNLLRKIKNTIEKMEAEFKSVKALKSFITGVLVNPHLILSATPSERAFGLGMRLTALGSSRFGEEADVIVHVNLNVNDVERLSKMLPELLRAARLHKGVKNLKEIHKRKTESRFGRRY